MTDRNERMTNNAGTNSELNARVTQVSNSNGSTDTMAVMTRVMEMVQQQIAQQTAQSAVQQQLTELLISQQRASQERHYEMIQWQQQTQKDMIEALRVTKQEPQNIGTRETDVARLPKVELPTFDGKLTEWPHFWESFSINVDSRRSLNGKQKLDLLHRLLKGAAFDKIKGLGLQGENYELAKGILKRHYEDPVKQKEMLWSKLRNLPMVKDNLHNLEKYIDELRATTLSLKRNGVAGEVLDAFVLEVRRKLPRNLIMELEKMRMYKEESLQTWQMEEFLTALERLNRVHETIGGMERNATSYGNDESTTPKSVPINDEKPNIPTASFNVNTEQNVRSKTMRACVFCNKDHFSDECKTMADVGSRRIAASKGGRCFKCLRKGHMARDCQRTKACFHCGKEGHHSALCFRREKSMISKRETHQLLNDNPVEHREEEPQMVNELEVSTENLTSTDVVMEGMLTQQESNDDHIVMAMFPAQAVNPETGESVVINVYLDSGAKRTCIDAQAAKQLNLRAKQELVLETSRFNTKKKENVNAELVELVLKGKDGYTLPMKAFSVSQLAPPMTIKPMRCSRQVWEAIERHDPVNKPNNHKESRPIHLLVGLDYWYTIMGLNVPTTPLCEGQQLVIHHTPLGNVLCGSLTNDNGKKNERSETMMADIEREPTSDSGGVKPSRALNVEQLICNVDYTSNEMMQRIWGHDGIGTNEPKPSGKVDSIPTQHGTANDQAFSESLLIVNASWPDWKDCKPTPRATWKLGKIVKLIPSTDEETRFVEVKFPSKIVTRCGERDLVSLELDFTENC